MHNCGKKIKEKAKVTEYKSSKEKVRESKYKSSKEKVRESKYKIWALTFWALTFWTLTFHFEFHYKLLIVYGKLSFKEAFT